MKLFLSLTFLIIVCMPVTHPALGSEVVVKGLFGGAAVIVVDGREILIKKGQKKAGILLVQADSEKAVVEIDGQQRTLYLSTHIDSSFATAEKSQVMINMTDNRQYITAGTINGRPVTYLIDTGANVIALNSDMAKSLDIALYDGVKTNVSTAGGTERAIRVVLKRVSVGGISRSNVAAVVIEGSHPQQILLGMSFLQHVDINENGRLMVLTSKL